jgi:sugar phosphate isomerase/epimerase
MLIGAMNHPRRSLPEQIEWLGKNGFDFLDLTLEPPEAASWKLNPPEVKHILADAGLVVVGHTAPFLPIASPVEGLRRAAVQEMLHCMDVFAEIGVKWMNVHPRTAPMHDRAFTIDRNLESLAELVRHGSEIGLGVMVENVPGFNTASELGDILRKLPQLGLHLDVGHANLMTSTNTTAEILGAFGDRLRHVHLHDNRGGELDLHLPLGAGNINLPESLRLLKQSGYDGTITLEVFSTDLNLLLYSRDLLRKLWQAAAAEPRKLSAGR